MVNWTQYYRLKKASAKGIGNELREMGLETDLFANNEFLVVSLSILIDHQMIEPCRQRPQIDCYTVPAGQIWYQGRRNCAIFER
jgi:hypothetical protein